MDMTSPAPVLFVGHGSPMNALEDNSWSRSWRELGRRLGRPRAILAVSAHWETKGLLVTGGAHPRTIHDFYGFPQALFDVEYPAPGDPALAGRIERLLAPFNARADLDGWGLDHGVWSILKWMYPDADVPVLQLSMDTRRTPGEHYAIGQALRPLREEGVLILASGNIVHNLRALNFRNSTPPEWAGEFDEAIRQRVLDRRDAEVVRWTELGPSAALAVPEAEHFLPLLYALGASEPGEKPVIFNAELFSSLSMTSAAFGLAPAA